MNHLVFFLVCVTNTYIHNQMGSSLCTPPKNVIMVEYDESNHVKNFTIHGCYYHAPLEFQFKRPSDIKSKTTVHGIGNPTCKDSECTSKPMEKRYCAKKESTKVIPVNA